MLSYILPWYKKLELFKQALPNNLPFFAQPDTEVVLALDEPSEVDGVLDLVRKTKDANFRVIVNDKEHAWRPPCKAINVGVRHAKGAWLAILSPETLLQAPRVDYLSRFVRAARASPERVFYTGLLLFQLPDGQMGQPIDEGYGFKLVTRTQFDLVCGYHEARQEWGGDDDDFMARLKAQGYARQTLPALRLYHLDHGAPGFGERSATEPIRESIPIYDWGRDFNRVVHDWELCRVEVFDGQGVCEVERCCEGRVLQRTVYEAPAWRNMVAAPLLAEQEFICQDCRKALLSQRKQAR